MKQSSPMAFLLFPRELVDGGDFLLPFTGAGVSSLLEASTSGLMISLFLPLGGDLSSGLLPEFVIPFNVRPFAGPDM